MALKASFARWPAVGLLLLACGPAPLDVIRRDDSELVPSQPPEFAAPVRIEALALPGPDDDPTFTADLLELYFSSSRAGGEDIWRSTRQSAAEPWGEAVIVSELNTDFIDATPGVAPDGLTIWLESTRAAQNQDLNATDIWMSRRATRQDAWSEPTLVTELSSDRRDSAPLPSSALLLTFSSWRDGGLGDTDLYVSVRTSPLNTWGPPTLLSEPSSSSWDQGLLRADGNQLFISSGREHDLNAGNLFWSSRPTLNSPFQAPVLLTDLSSNSDDEDIWVSEDLDYVVFASDRDGDLDLYEARRR